MQSPIYWHPSFYRMAMKMAYGEQFLPRYEALQKYIPENASVFEVCAGDVFFYEHFLKKKNISYSCADINPVFVRHAKALGLDAKLMDVLHDAIPACDYILMQASLYHFIPDEGEIIRKLMKAAKKQVIISESVSNLSNSGSGLKSSIGTFLSKAKSGQSRIKFTRETLKQSFEPFSSNIVTWDDDPSRREVIVVLGH